MAKIGILTYFWSDNPGTFLQAYSTCMAVKEVFEECEVELINCAFDKIKLNIGRNSIAPKQFYQALRRYFIYTKCQKDLLPLSKASILTTNTQKALSFIKEQKYDLILVGADTILNFSRNNFEEDCIPFYWLSENIKCKKVLCAASAGTLTIDRMSENQRKSCECSINDFNLLGVRDHSTLELMQKLYKGNHCKIQMVSDPTFTFEIDHSYAKAYLERKHIDMTRPILALNTLNSFKYADCLAKYFKNKGYQIVSLMPSCIADISLFDISPFEWAGIFKFFNLVVTDRFHGTLFSLKNKTPVLGVLCDRAKTNYLGRSKVLSLLKDVGIERTNYLDCFTVNSEAEVIDFAEKARDHFEYKKMHDALNIQKRNYISFLDEIKPLLF